jgi:hypothetical protein
MQIKDLSVELAAEAMTAVHGGGNLTQSNAAVSTQAGLTQVGPVASLVGAQSNTANMLSNIEQANIGLNNDVFEDNDTALVGAAFVSLIGQ